VTALRVIVDLDRCEANGVCAGIAPEVFELDDDDNLTVLQEAPSEELRARLEQAALSCPKQAIRLDG